MGARPSTWLRIDSTHWSTRRANKRKAEIRTNSLIG
jgi:hypothetical protein